MSCVCEFCPFLLGSTLEPLVRIGILICSPNQYQFPEGKRKSTVVMHSKVLPPTQVTPSILDSVYGLAPNVYQPGQFPRRDRVAQQSVWNTNTEPYGLNFSCFLKYKTIVTSLSLFMGTHCIENYLIFHFKTYCPLPGWSYHSSL